MPLFISDDELARHSNEAFYVAAKADDFIRTLQSELDTFKASADAASITAEQTCSLLEHKFLSLSTEFNNLQSQHAHLQSSLDDRLADLAELQALKHQLHLQSIGKDGEIERLSTEVSELHKSKRQLIELVAQKDLEISEKNATINAYLDKIVNLTGTASEKEARLSEIEAEFARSQAMCTRLSQEKELIEKHNTWLNDELKAKVDVLIELRKTHADFEEDMSAKLADAERRFAECSSSLKWNKEKVEDLSKKLTSLQEELCSSMDAATANEERFSAELSTVNKLVELYKESSEEWSRKAGELEGVIKALETHLSQVENDYRERLEKEVSARKKIEKEAADLKDRVERFEADVEKSRKATEMDLLPLSSFTMGRLIDPFGNDDIAENNDMLIPRIPVGVSGTALAASLIRDGWSLAKMYAKYQEAVDALRHEQLGRKESEAILQRVLSELEEKAGVILDERAEYERMVESHSVINQKLQHSISEQENLQKIIQELKVDLRRHEREYGFAQKEIVDLQKQVTVLLKECRDIQLRCGSDVHDQGDESTKIAAVGMNMESDADTIISERLLTFKDINGLVEQNVQLRSLVRSLSDQVENRELELKEKFEMELKKHTDEAASKVAAVLQRAEEQGHMIESLHTSVAMYKRLYEEEHKRSSSYLHSSDMATVAEDGRNNILHLLEGSKEDTKKAQEKAAVRLKSLEEDLEKSRNDIISLRSERDKLALDAKISRDRFDSLMGEFEHQKQKLESLGARNVEISQLIIDYQRKHRESSEAFASTEELSRKLSMEVSVLKHEKEMLSNAEKRAYDEVRHLSERVYRLQSSLDTIQSTEEVREEARAAERRRQEEHIKQVEREWAQAKKELQQERDNVRSLTSEREQTMKNAMRQVEEMGKELANALHAVSAAETRAAVAEAKLADVEKKIATSDHKITNIEDSSVRPSVSTSEDVTDLVMAKKEIEKLREESQANREHMLQYKSIAQVNEAALKEVELAHEKFKMESEKLKESLEAEILSLRERISELLKELSLKCEEAATAAAGKEEALASTWTEINCLKEESSYKTSQIVALETQISALKEDLDKEHERRCAAQANYEQQVILQSEAIQESRKLSQALAALQQEVSGLRKLADTQKIENDQLKEKWQIEKSMLEDSKNEAEKKYEELNEQNRILHSRVEALHIQLAEKDRNSTGISSGSNVFDPHSDGGLQSVITYLRRSKEIAETEISLLKQEKLRLQSQLESALKAAETAQASLHTERTNSRAMLFSEEEIKSLQLQVRELNLLRESNVQLREENKHNFEECQKSREVAQKVSAQFDHLESLLKEREIEIEACRKEIEMGRMAKDCLERRVSELLERTRNIDVDHYDRMKDDVRQMQEKMREKDAEIEEIKNLVSKQQEMISKLEEDLAKSELEMNERENRINDLLQMEANLKMELEKYKKMANQWKKRAENLSKEKDEFSKDKQALSKQIEDLKQGKRTMGTVSGEQVMKEKEEKEHRIQILEKIMERTREELRKEREDHRTERTRRQSSEKAIMDSIKNVDQVKTDFVNKFEKHKQALHQLSDELEKLKHAEANLPEGTSVVQLLSGTILDDLSAAYVSAVENFEKVAHSVSVELGASASMETTSVPDTSKATTTGHSVASQANVISSIGPKTSYVAAKAREEKGRQFPAPKTSFETRKTGRKLVRPRLVRPEEPQSDVEMSEADGSSGGGKLATSHDSETQQNSALLSQPMPRKRVASSASELNEQILSQEESPSDATAPVPKRTKGSDSPPVVDGESAAPSETPMIIPVVEEASDAVGHIPQVSNEEVVSEKEEIETTGDKTEPPKEFEQFEQESEQLDSMNQAELQNEDNDAREESLDKPRGTGMEFDVGLKDETVEEIQQSTMESETEREEGELVTDVAEVEEGADIMVGSPEIAEAPPEVGTTPVASPLRIDDEDLVGTGVDLGEINSSEIFNEEKNDEGDAIEDTAEGSDKSNDGNDQIVEADQISENATVAEGSTIDTSKRSSSCATEAEEIRQVSPASNTSTLVNLKERARQNAERRRQFGAQMHSPSSSRGRGGGRVVRGGGRGGGRVVRGRGRSGQGHGPGQQG